jgi:hypothetical protein
MTAIYIRKMIEIEIHKEENLQIRLDQIKQNIRMLKQQLSEHEKN